MRFLGEVTERDLEPVILVKVEIPSHAVTEILDFIVDTGSNVTIVPPSDGVPSPQFAGWARSEDVRGLGGRVKAWTIPQAKLSILGEDGVWHPIAPKEVVGVKDDRFPRILGVDSLDQADLAIHYAPAKRSFYLER